MLISRTDQIHLWLVFTDEIQDPSLLEEYRVLLTDEERAQEKRFYFAKDQHRYLLTRALVRTTLSRYVSVVAPADWRFSKNEYGRPEIADHEHIADGLSFNITHTLGLIILGVTKTHALGVDAENLRRHQVSLGIADRFFSPTEVSELYSLPEENQVQRFFEYWTLKESYIKARGMGLSIPLDQFSFHFPRNEEVDIALDERLNDPGRWRFWQMQLTPDLISSVCVADTDRTRPSLLVKKIVPTRSEQNFDYVLLRQSK